METTGRKSIFSSFLALAASLVMVAACSDEEEVAAVEQARPDSPLGFWPEDYRCDTLKVKQGDTFSGVMVRLGMQPDSAHFLSLECHDSVFNLRKDFKVDDVMVACYDKDSTASLAYVLYLNNKIRTTVFRCSDSLSVRIHDKDVNFEDKTCDVTIHSSLWNDMIEAGASPMLIMSLADIYQWTVNFFGLQDGDRFRVKYRQKVCEDEIIAIDRVDFSIYDSGSQQVCAIYFDQGDKGNKYWSEKGESLKKAFLKAPLKFNRVSSRFTYHRKHPITGKVRPHTGVDYAAPSGTPVHSIGDGTVVLRTWDSSGGGNYLKIRHANGYMTGYMHLKGFAKGIQVGSRVSQGQLIGYVGSTGRSTGPHLDFRVWKNNTPVDPLKMISPPAAPISGQNLDSLKVLYNKYLAEFGN